VLAGNCKGKLDGISVPGADPECLRVDLKFVAKAGPDLGGGSNNAIKIARAGPLKGILDG